MVNPRLPALFQNIDAALMAISVFIRALTEEGAKLYGSEGSNAGMLRALKAMNLCFDWTRWVRNRPSKNCIDEFGHLCDLLKPVLRHTRYPSKDDFPDVRHAWPDSKVSRGALLGIISTNHVRVTHGLGPPWTRFQAISLQMCFRHSSV